MSSTRSRVAPGVPTGGQFAAETKARSAVALDDVTSTPQAVHPDISEGTPEGRFRYLMAMEPDTDEAVLREVFAPEKVAANAGRIYDHMRENGIGADSATREAAFAYAASALDRPYNDFYDAWMDERPVDLDRAEPPDGISAATRRAQRIAQDRHRRLESGRVAEAEKKVSDLTSREHATLTKMPLDRLRATVQKLEQRPEKGFRATGPEERSTILTQIGDGPVGNVAAISGHRVVPLPDGVELPVSGGVKVRVRLADDDTYTVQRVRTRGENEKLLGEREGVYADNLAEIAYRAGMYQSYDGPEEW